MPDFTTQDILITSVLDQLSTLQPVFYAANGRYWQGRQTPATIPTQGSAAAVDDTVKPTNEAADWTAFGVTLPDTSDLALRVDTYSGPDGDGYVLLAQTIVAGETWKRVSNVGPEISRESPWAIFQEEI